MVIPDSKNDHSALLERFASLLTADDITSDQKTAQLCLDEAVRAVKLDKKLQALITSKDVMDLSDETIDNLTKTDFELRFIDGAEKVRSSHLPKDKMLRKFTIGLAYELFNWTSKSIRVPASALIMYMRDGSARAFLTESGYHAEALHELIKWNHEKRRFSQVSYRTADNRVHVVDSSVFGSKMIIPEELPDDVEIVTATDSVREVVEHIAESKRINFEETPEYWCSRFP